MSAETLVWTKMDTTESPSLKLAKKGFELGDAKALVQDWDQFLFVMNLEAILVDPRDYISVASFFRLLEQIMESGGKFKCLIQHHGDRCDVAFCHGTKR
jgi:hypothetical protein